MGLLLPHATYGRSGIRNHTHQLLHSKVSSAPIYASFRQSISSSIHELCCLIHASKKSWDEIPHSSIISKPAHIFLNQHQHKRDQSTGSVLNWVCCFDNVSSTLDSTVGGLKGSNLRSSNPNGRRLQSRCALRTDACLPCAARRTSRRTLGTFPGKFIDT